MRSKYVVLVSIIVVFGLVVVSANIGDKKRTENPGVLTWSTFEDAFVRAKRENKKIILDIYTTWCGWCKKMDAEVYGNFDIAQIIDKHFIPVKLNAESSERITFGSQSMTEREFAQALGVTGYPTTVFFDQEGKPITLVPGYFSATEFQKILTYFGEDHHKKIPYEKFQPNQEKID